MSSSADAYGGGGGGGGGGGDHHHYQMYHVPQHSRREKLRFPPEESQTTPPLLFHDSNAAPPPPPLFPTNYFPSSSSSPSPFYPHNPHIGFSPQPQFISAGHMTFPQMPHQGFSLSLSSSSPPHPPPPPPPPPPPSSSSSSRPQFGPFGPFTGYAAVLNRSRFLGPARELLEEICDVGRRSAVPGGDGSGDEGLGDGDPVEAISSVDHGIDGGRGGEEGGISGAECQWKKTRLVSMLEEVCKRYKHYCQQVQAVMASFESVSGLSTAAPFASMALKAMTKHFRFFKSIISNQLRQTHKFLGKEGPNKEEFSNFGHISSGISVQKTNTGTFGQPHVWRPQRGLPERAVAVLRAWLFEHFLHPYPTDTDKQMLAKQTGLTRNQVSNWFINARVRLWKPMVEEIHSLEMRQLQKHSSADKNSDGSHPLPSHQAQDTGANPSGFRVPQASNSDKNRTPTCKRFQDDLPQIPQPIQEPINFVYDGLSSHQHIGVGLGVTGGGNGGVSLTLGLHQNNRVSLAEPLPLNVVHRFGLEECNDAYVMGSFEGQDRQFAKEIGGHLLHDFVG